MNIMNIKVSIDVKHAGSLHQDILTAGRALVRAIEASSAEEPALGGELKTDKGERVGSYLVEYAK